MKIIVNGAPHDLADETLDGLLATLGYDDGPIATALNGAFVPRAARAATTPSDGDRVEVVAPMQGG